MKNLKILWVDDNVTFGPSIHVRIKSEVVKLGFNLAEIETLQNGKYVWDTVRDWKPDIIMMDHNLDDVKINGANLIIEIRFHNNETPIIFYSSEMDDKLISLIDDEVRVYPSTRDDVGAELLHLIQTL
jgi:CheY-like chemotaxis protein